MLWEVISNWPYKVSVNDTLYEDAAKAYKNALQQHEKISSIVLHSKRESVSGRTPDSLNDSTLYRVCVRQYMTKPASSSFDFMLKWNKNVPMPLRSMIGHKLKETPGMVYMQLWGDITEKTTQYCMRCGKLITNPVSKFFGMGPECGGHNYVNPFNSEEELKAVVENYRKNYLQKITWSGWIIKSAIEHEEIVNEGQITN